MIFLCQYGVVSQTRFWYMYAFLGLIYHVFVEPVKVR